MAKDVIITPISGSIQFKNSSGTSAGKIEQSGDDLVLSNAVGDILLGDGTADVYVGDGISNVDIIFEQNGSIKGEIAAGVTLTLGSNDTTLHLTGSTLALQKDGGNVGIGTTSPGPKLHTVGAGYFSGQTVSASALSLDQEYSNVGLIINEEDHIYTKDNNSLRKLIGKTADIIEIGQSGTSLIDGIKLLPGTSNGYVSFYDHNTEYARFQSGSLGIGTTSPSYKLTSYDTSDDTFPIVAGAPVNISSFTGIGLSGFVASNGAVKAAMVLQRVGTYGTGDIHFLNNSTENNSDATLADAKMTIKEDGNVGIGTTTPNFLLDVESPGAGARVYNTTGATSVYLTTSASNNANLYFGPSTDVDEGSIIYRTAGQSMAFTTNTSEAMRIDSSGNVGIGTTTSPEKLTVEGNISSSGTIVGSNLSGTNTGDQDLSGYIQSSQTSSMSVATASYVAGSDVDGAVASATNADTLDSLDSTQFVRSDANDTITGDITFGSEAKLIGTQASTTQDFSILEKFLANPAAEDGEQADVRILNNLAGANKWATITLTDCYQSDRTTAVTDLGSNAFDGTSAFSQLYQNAAGDPLVIQIDLPNQINWSAWVGIIFGNASWRTKSVKIETFRNGAWQTECDLTNQASHIVSRKVDSNDSNGVTKIKYTLDDLQNTTNHYIRILSLFNFNYRTGAESYGGVHYIDKYKNTSHYSTITPATDSTYDLGSTSLRYSNVYADTLHGTVTTATTASYVAAANIDGTIDISDQTNLAGGTNLTLSGDTMNLDANISLTSITASAISASGTVVGSNLSGTNTGNVTLAGSYDYITLSGQTITRNQVDASTDISNLTTTNVSEGTNLYYTDARVKTKLNTEAVVSGSATQVRSFLNVEDGADVTDTANVTAAGALMDSEVDADIKTLSLPANTTISAFGKTLVDDADAATARTTLDVDQAGTDNSTNVTLAGAYDYITISGQQITRNQIDASTDISNLTTANVSEVTNLYYTDARVKTKLNAESVVSGSATQVRTFLNVEDGADVTDTANVTAAGALMDSELTSITDVKALNQSVVSGASPTFSTTNMTDATNKRFMSDAQETKLDSVESNADVTDETNVVSSLSGATLTDLGTPAAGDLILLQDASDSNNLKVAQFSTFGGGGGAVATYTNGSNDRIITSTGTDGINGEANLTFDGSTLALNGNISSSGTSDNFFGGRLVLDNSKYIVGTETGGSTRNILSIDGSNITQVANGNLATNIKGTSISIDNALTLDAGDFTVTNGNVRLFTNNTQITGRTVGGSPTEVDIIGVNASNVIVVGNATTDEVELTGNTKVVGNLTLDDAADTTLTLTGSLKFRMADSTYTYQGELSPLAGTLLTAGEVYHYSGSGWVVADASDDTATRHLGVAVSATDVMIKGYIRNVAYAGLGTGNVLYLSTTAGDVTNTPPSTAGEYVRVLGYSVDSTTRVIYFNPSQDWIEL